MSPTEVPTYMKRLLCALMTTLLLVSMLPHAGLAISGQEALFGNDVPADNTSETGSNNATYPTLRPGDRDADDSAANIVFMQNRLIELGYLADSADGSYGESTEKAVLAFQRNNNLPETGVADTETQRKLFSDISTLVLPASDDAAFGGDLTRIQSILGLWGFYGGKIDGLTGSGTSNAIRDFKHYMLMLDPAFGTTPTPAPTATPDPNGKFSDMPVIMDRPLVDQAELDRTNDAVTATLMEYVNGEKPFTLYHQDVKGGDSNEDALRVQTRLHQLKYVYGTDGNFGDLSVLGLKYFQRKNELPETGVADRTTQELLFSNSAVESEEYVFPYKLVVDVSDQKVRVAQWNGSKYEGPIHTFTCATGKKETPTPLGTYQAGGKTGNEWYYFKEFGCYAKWAYHIVGGVLFHSNTVSKIGDHPGDGGLGHPASHGCIRMKLKEVKWIYDNCPEGTTVVVQE